MKKTLLITILLLLSACSLPPTEINSGISSTNTQNINTPSLFPNYETVDTNKYLLYRPQKSENQTLIFLIPPDVAGLEKTLIDIWKPYADQNNFIIASPKIRTFTDVNNALTEINNIYQPTKIFVSGFSAGGYNSCLIGFKNPNIINGIIPMGAFCSVNDLNNNKPQNIPILVVVGENDNWARGDDFTLIDNATKNLKKYNITQEQIIVPGIGHDYPNGNIPQVIEWILKH